MLVSRVGAVLCCRLANENQLKETQQKIFEIQRENDEIMSKLTKKDRECEAKTIERVSLNFVSKFCFNKSGTQRIKHI